MTTQYLAFSSDSGWMSLCTVGSAVIVFVSGIQAMRSARMDSRKATRLLVAHVFAIVAVGAVGACLHFLTISGIHAARANSQQFDPELAAMDRSLLATQDAWFAGIVATGAILGAIAAIGSKTAQQDVTPNA